MSGHLGGEELVKDPALGLGGAFAAARHLGDGPGREQLVGELVRAIEEHGGRAAGVVQDGDAAGQDLLGLLTAAQGGLSGRDLEELTGTPLWDIEQILYSTVGRTFARQVSRRAAADGPDTYLLGHIELQAAATEYLGPRRLDGYRDRLHRWADSYRQRRWPQDTPEYLLTDYYLLLVTTSDLSRVVASAGDMARHDRMLDLSGGDESALSEIRTALDLIGRKDPSALPSALRLAFHRDRLQDRSDNIPLNIPAIWTSLGQQRRARALVAAIISPDGQALAIAHVSAALARAGMQEQAAAAANEAADVARLIPNPQLQAHNVERIAGKLAQAEQYPQARAVASAAGDSIAEAQCLVRIVSAMAANGEYQQAEDLTRTITSPEWQEAQARLARSLAAAGKLTQAERLIRPLTIYGERARALAALGSALPRAGWHSRAAAAFAEARAAARSISNEYSQAEALVRIAGELAEAGEHAQAIETVGRVTFGEQRACGLAKIGSALARAGSASRADDVFAQALAATRSISHRDTLGHALVRITRELAMARRHKHAQETARSIADPFFRSRALADLAEELVAAGMLQEAAATVTEAEAVARSITIPAGNNEEGWLRVIRALISAGQFKQAEDLACSQLDPEIAGWALAEAAEELAAAGQFKQAKKLARSITDKEVRSRAEATTFAVQTEGHCKQDQELAPSADWYLSEAPAMIAVTLAVGQFKQAEELARSITSVSLRAEVLAQAAAMLTEAGQFEPVEELARSITRPRQRGDALAQLGEILAAGGQYEHAEAVARSVAYPADEGRARARVAEMLAAAGQGVRAEQLARSIAHPDQRGRALVWVANAQAAAGQYDYAEQIARSIAAPDLQVEILATLAEVLARAGDTWSACRMAVAVCATAPWMAAAPLVLRLDSSAFTPIAAELQGDKGNQEN